MAAPVKTISVSTLKKNPNNPRILKDDKFEKLKKSIQEFPQMMELRPLVIDNQRMVLGGNMRLEAIKALGMKVIPESWVKRADKLTDEQKRRFIIADNVAFGEWDWDALANEWDQDLLVDWGLEVNFSADDDAGENDTSSQLGGLEHRVVIDCDSESQQAELLERFEREGLKCRALIS